MSVVVALAIGSSVLIILAGLLGVIWSLLNGRIESLWDQVGRDSDHGMRRTVHNTSNLCTLANGAVDEHDRRLEHLERRVFNGHGKP